MICFLGPIFGWNRKSRWVKVEGFNRSWQRKTETKHEDPEDHRTGHCFQGWSNSIGFATTYLGLGVTCHIEWWNWHAYMSGAWCRAAARGTTYSSRIKYQLLCGSLVLAHEPRFLALKNDHQISSDCKMFKVVFQAINWGSGGTNQLPNTDQTLRGAQHRNECAVNLA